MSFKNFVGDLFGFNSEIKKLISERNYFELNLINVQKVLHQKEEEFKNFEIALSNLKKELIELKLENEKLNNIVFESDVEKFWNNKYPKVNVGYAGRTFGNSNEMIPIDVRLLITPQDFNIHEILKKNKLYLKDNNNNVDKTVIKIYKFIKNNYYKYLLDFNNYGLTEFWEFPFEILEKKKRNGNQGFDCLEEHTEIITKQGYKKIKDVTIEDEVYSYNFETKQAEWKKVLNVWDKGILPTKKLKFFGGSEIISTDDHKFYFRNKNSNGISEYTKKKLSEHNISEGNRNMKNKVPYLIKQPYEIKDIDELTENDCFIIGYYLAEGWGSKTKNTKYLCGYELEDNILPVLDELNITYNYFTNSTGCPQINLHKSYLNKYLDNCGRISYEKKVPNELKNLPTSKLNKIIEGYHLGDGSKDNLNRVVFTTVSEKLADDVIEILNKLGRPSNKFFIKNCGGFGNSEVYRIDVNNNSYRLRNYGYENLSENTLINIEEYEDKHVYDIEVEDNHNFFLKNGILVGNCDSWANFMASFYIASGVPSWKVRVVVGNCQLGGHSSVYVYSDDDNKFHHLNSTYGNKWSKFSKISDYPVTDDALDSDSLGIKDVWFSFNNLYSWNKFSSEASKQFKKNNDFVI